MYLDVLTPVLVQAVHDGLDVRDGLDYEGKAVVVAGNGPETKQASASPGSGLSRPESAKTINWGRPSSRTAGARIGRVG